MSRLIAKVEDEEMEMEELTAHASTLVYVCNHPVSRSIYPGMAVDMEGGGKA